MRRAPRGHSGDSKVTNAATALILAFPQIDLGTTAQPKFEELCRVMGVYPSWHPATLRQAQAVANPNLPPPPTSPNPSAASPDTGGYVRADQRGMPFSDVDDL